MNILINVLIIISGICWSIVYVESIRLGFKQKTYAMPLFALGLNIVWEGLYAFTDIFVRQSIGAQAIANTCLFFLDCIIVYTYFKFGINECKTKLERKWFVPWSIFTFATCIALQILFYYWFGNVEGEKYAAYLQNIVMSVMYLYMLKERKSNKGQSMIIALCKCIGTLTPTIYGTLEGNWFILVTGIICFVFDLIYIYFLFKLNKYEKEPLCQ